jgi:hypothetical protein
VTSDDLCVDNRTERARIGISSTLVTRLEGYVTLMQKFSSILCLLAMLFVLADPVHGQTKLTSEEKSPEAIAARALTALKENRIGDFAKAMHPEALQQLKATLLDVVDVAEKKGRVDEALSIFKNVGSAADLRKLDDVAFFTAFFEGVMQMQPRLRDAFRGMTLDVIEHVPEGKDIIHVVYRGTVTQGETKVSKMSVMSLKANGDDWGMLLTGDIEGMTAMLKRQFNTQD